MKSRMALLLLGLTLIATSGCYLHPPYGMLNDNTTFIPPLGKLTHRNNLPPANMLMEPGPGVGGPGPGVLAAAELGGMGGALTDPAWRACALRKSRSPVPTAWPWPGTWAKSGMFDSDPLIVPGRYNFPVGGIYRMKLTNIPGRPGVELYPTLEIGPPTPRTEAYLAHNAIPAQFTEEDFDQVLSGNFVTKVIYLPDPEFQELALAGVETLVSTRLDPGFDPIVEADRRGAILAIIRVGNKDLEAPGGEAELSGVYGCSFAGAVGPDGGGLRPGMWSGLRRLRRRRRVACRACRDRVADLAVRACRVSPAPCRPARRHRSSRA